MRMPCISDFADQRAKELGDESLNEDYIDARAVCLIDELCIPYEQAWEIAARQIAEEHAESELEAQMAKRGLTWGDFL
jgi:hypothetical protein